MSWQDILEISLLRSGKISKAAIVGQDGQVWAESADHNMTGDERNAILVNGFGTHPMREMSVGGRRYEMTMGCLDVILGKRKDGGCVLKKTGQSVIVAEYVSSAGDPDGAEYALALVERLADYLISKGY